METKDFWRAAASVALVLGSPVVEATVDISPAIAAPAANEAPEIQQDPEVSTGVDSTSKNIEAGLNIDFDDMSPLAQAAGASTFLSALLLGLGRTGRRRKSTRP